MSQRPELRLITIDLDDTLWSCAPVLREAEAALYAWLCARAPRLTALHDPDSLREHRRELMRERPEIAHDVTAVRLTALRQLLGERGYPDTLADEAMAVFQRARNRVEPWPEVAPVLGRLRRHCRLVSVTNGNAEVQETALRDAFDRCLTAAEAGAAKPAPAMFELALRWAGVNPEQALHIGDDPLLDVDAARQLGMAAVWVNRAGRAWPSELDPPVFEVRDLNALERWLEPGLGR